MEDDWDFKMESLKYLENDLNSLYNPNRIVLHPSGAPRFEQGTKSLKLFVLPLNYTPYRLNTTFSLRRTGQEEEKNTNNCKHFLPPSFLS
jgi:hypothetical protein